MLTVAFIYGAGVDAIYYLGYAVVQERVSPDQIGLATGCTGAIGYLLAAASGLFIGLIAQAVGYISAVYVVLLLPQLLAIVGDCILAWEARK